MKTRIFTTAIMMFLISLASFGQPGMGYGPCHDMNKDSLKMAGMTGIPNLTDKQMEQIKTLRTEHLKTVTKKRNLLKEKRAHLTVLMTQDHPDQKAIDKTIGEINLIRGELLKERVGMQLKIRNLLTDEQKVYFDKKLSGMGMHKKGKRHGKHPKRSMR